MFTGLIEEIGTLGSIAQIQSGRRFEIIADSLIADLAVGDSISIDGVCLTVIGKTRNLFFVEAVGETLSRSTLSTAQAGQLVNLERALKANGRLDGHFVQGHVDGVGKILSIDASDPGFWLKVQVPDAIADFFVEKGSIAIDGISLTLAEVRRDVVGMAIIPHTASHTTIGRKKAGNFVNVEVDILCKYVRKHLLLYQDSEIISLNKLKKWGFE
jgi:riboflavin synthase